MKNLKKAGLVWSILLLWMALLLTACSAKYQEKMSMPTKTSSIVNEDNRKTVYSAILTLETGDLLAVERQIMNVLSDKGGYAETIDVTKDGEKRHLASYILRIPQNRLTEFLDTITDFSGIVIQQRKLTAVDVTNDSVDIEAKLNNLQLQENRLREILVKAQSVDEILKVENELTRVRTQIESTTVSIKKMNLAIDMSVVNITITERWSGSRDGFSGKIIEALRDGLTMASDIFIFLMMMLVGLIPVYLLGVFLWWFRRRWKAKNTN